MIECDCCDIPHDNVYNNKGMIIDFKCTACGKLQSEDIKRVIYCIDGLESFFKRGEG